MGTLSHLDTVVYLVAAMHSLIVSTCPAKIQSTDAAQCGLLHLIALCVRTIPHRNTATHREARSRCCNASYRRLGPMLSHCATAMPKCPPNTSPRWPQPGRRRRLQHARHRRHRKPPGPTSKPSPTSQLAFSPKTLEPTTTRPDGRPRRVNAWRSSSLSIMAT